MKRKADDEPTNSSERNVKQRVIRNAVLLLNSKELPAEIEKSILAFLTASSFGALQFVNKASQQSMIEYFRGLQTLVLDESMWQYNHDPPLNEQSMHAVNLARRHCWSLQILKGGSNSEDFKATPTQHMRFLCDLVLHNQHTLRDVHIGGHCKWQLPLMCALALCSELETFEIFYMQCYTPDFRLLEPGMKILTKGCKKLRKISIPTRGNDNQIDADMWKHVLASGTPCPILSCVKTCINYYLLTRFASGRAIY